YAEPGHLATLKRHQLPTRYRGVRFASQFVAPATELWMLAVEDELKRLLCRIAQFGILRHAIRFAQRDRRNAMAIVTNELCLACEQVAVRLLLGDEPLKAAGDCVMILTGVVRVAGAEKRE